MRRLVPARLASALRHDAATPFELPGDIVRESRRRVRIAAAIGAVAYAVFLGFESSRVVASSSLEHSIDLTHDVAGLSLCVLVWLVTAVRPIGDRAVLAFALVAEVALCALISVSVHWAAFVRTEHVQALTWVVPVILLFPLLVPAPPLTATVVSILCALTMPGGLWVLEAMGAIDVQASDYLAGTLAGGVGVGIAAVASRAIYGATRQAAAARRMGSYELLEPLGQGGMGEVWKARHTFLARPAAVKLILPDTLRGPMEERDAVVKRFTREAQVTASLRSPHTVELFDFGVSADGTFYYAMELLEGLNVERFVYRFGPIEPRRAVHWLIQACHSLGEAHARGLVHRDIKPANLFLCRYGRDVDFVKVLDFGLTKPLAGQEDLTLTTPGRRMGTPSYMAPEQVFGVATDPRTDLYALGGVAYWLLAGVKPFEGDAGEIMRQQVLVTPPPLPSQAQVPARLEAVIMRCLAKEASVRPANADGLAEELRGSVDRAWTADEARRSWERELGRAEPTP